MFGFIPIVFLWVEADLGAIFRFYLAPVSFFLLVILSIYSILFLKVQKNSITKRRWRKTNNIANITTEFYWSGSRLIGENKSGVVRRYILEAVTPVGFIENGDVYHYFRDHLGTAHEITDNNGGLVWCGRPNCHHTFCQINHHKIQSFYDGFTSLPS